MSDHVESGLSPVEELLAIERIKRLKGKYFRSVDTKDWKSFASVFTADVVVDFRGTTTDSGSGARGLDDLDNDKVVSGRAKWAKMVEQSNTNGNLTTMHHGHMPEIEITSPTTARGIWSMEDLVFWMAPGAAYKSMHGWGYYHETYECVGGQWLIKSVRLSRVRLDLVPA